MRKRHLRPSIRFALECVTIALFAASFISVMLYAAIQKSYEMMPPTSAEINDDPSLLRYVRD